MGFNRRFRTRRTKRYWDLRAAGFLPIEAREFSKLTRQYPALLQMMAQRQRFVQAVRRDGDAKGWSNRRKEVELRRRVTRFYEHLPRLMKKRGGRPVEWIVSRDVHGRKVRPRLNVWEYYDWIFKQLPGELKWDSPRSHRQVKQKEVQIDKIQTRMWIEDLRKSIANSRNPLDKERFEQQIRNLERSLRR